MNQRIAKNQQKNVGGAFLLLRAVESWGHKTDRDLAFQWEKERGTPHYIPYRHIITRKQIVFLLNVKTRYRISLSRENGQEKKSRADFFWLPY